MRAMLLVSTDKRVTAQTTSAAPQEHRYYPKRLMDQVFKAKQENQNRDSCYEEIEHIPPFIQCFNNRSISEAIMCMLASARKRRTR